MSKSVEIQKLPKTSQNEIISEISHRTGYPIEIVDNILNTFTDVLLDEFTKVKVVQTSIGSFVPTVRPPVKNRRENPQVTIEFRPRNLTELETRLRKEYGMSIFLALYLLRRRGAQSENAKKELIKWTAKRLEKPRKWVEKKAKQLVEKIRKGAKNNG